MLWETAAVAESFVCSAALTVLLPSIEARLSADTPELSFLTRLMLGLHPVYCALFMASLFAGVLCASEWLGADGGIVDGMRRLVATWVRKAPGGGRLAGKGSLALSAVLIAWPAVLLLTALAVLFPRLGAP